MRGLAAVAGVLLLAGCSGPVKAEEVASAPSSAPSPVASVAADLPREFPGNGSFVGGVDVAPGIYLEVAPAPNCEWFLGKDGKLLGSGEGDVVVRAGETVEVHACSVFKWAADPT